MVRGDHNEDGSDNSNNRIYRIDHELHISMATTHQSLGERKEGVLKGFIFHVRWDEQLGVVNLHDNLKYGH